MYLGKALKHFTVIPLNHSLEEQQLPALAHHNSLPSNSPPSTAPASSQPSNTTSSSVNSAAWAPAPSQGPILSRLRQLLSL